MQLWQLSRHNGLIQLRVNPELLTHVGARHVEIHETEYAKKGELAFTASGVYGAISLNFPVSGAIEYADESSRYFTIRPSMDFTGIEDNDLEMEM